MVSTRPTNGKQRCQGSALQTMGGLHWAVYGAGGKSKESGFRYTWIHILAAFFLPLMPCGFKYGSTVLCLNFFFCQVEIPVPASLSGHKDWRWCIIVTTMMTWWLTWIWIFIMGQTLCEACTLAHIECPEWCLAHRGYLINLKLTYHSVLRRKWLGEMWTFKHMNISSPFSRVRWRNCSFPGTLIQKRSIHQMDELWLQKEPIQNLWLDPKKASFF